MMLDSSCDAWWTFFHQASVITNAAAELVAIHLPISGAAMCVNPLKDLLARGLAVGSQYLVPCCPLHIGVQMTTDTFLMNVQTLA